MVEGLPAPDSKDLDLLRNNQRRNYSRLVIKAVVGIFGALLGILLTVYLVRQVKNDEASPAYVQDLLSASGFNWEEDVPGQIAAYREWLGSHGTAMEASIFDDTSLLLVKSMVASVGNEPSRSDLGIFRQLYLSLHIGLIRVVFLVLASLRACIVLVLGAVIFGLRSYRPHEGDDALGQMGNGRLFYSGVRAGLEKITPEGAPDVQVRGLACPQFSPQGETRASQIWKVLGEYGAQNATNEALAAIVVRNAGVSSYVATPEDEGRLSKAFVATALGAHTADLLAAALSLHARYAQGEADGPIEAHAEEVGGAPLSSWEYAQAVQLAMHRVLSPDLRRELGELSPAEIATAVLSFECGKVLAHSFEGGRWIRRSQFPQLSARAVLHSIVAYPQDYGFDERRRIRQALIYSSRSSSFAPVRMPLGLDSVTWALRQWMEILLASPHQLRPVADEVELVGLVRAAHTTWCAELLDGSALLSPDTAGQSFATGAGLLLVPLRGVITALRRSISPSDIRRIESLLVAVTVSQRQAAAEAAKRDGEAADTVSFERILPPLRDAEVTSLALLHGVAVEDLKDWSALRIVLTSYGWLARRVGDYTVPESSVIFAVFKSRDPLPGANMLGLVGKSGLVPFRGAKFEATWGGSWAAHFALADKATMAETTEDFEKLMKGIEEKAEEESPGGGSPVTA